jgi:glutamine synthetase adenylyltransferase
MIRSALLTVQTESIREVQIETRREQLAFGPISELEDGPGGLTVLYHVGQSLQLKHGTAFPALFDDSPLEVFPKLCEKGVLDVTGESELGRAAKLLREVRAVIHASMVDRNDVNLTKSLELALARAGGEPDYESLKSALVETMSAVRYASKELLTKTRPADH